MPRRLLVVCLPALLLLAGCEAEKSKNPLSPAIAGPIPGVEISPPKLLEPGQGAKFKTNQQPIRLLIENAWSTGVRPLVYRFEVAADAEFRNIVFKREGVPPGENGRTSLTLPDRLADGRSYYWRAQAYDGANTGPYAAAVTFEIYPPVVIHPPQPLEPIGRQVVATFTPKLRIRNSVRSGPAGPIVYTFQLSDNETFTAIAASGSVGEGPGETEFNPGVTLTPNNEYHWRVRASDGEVTTDWTATQSFVTPAAPPPPSGGGGGGASCGSREPIDIVTCHRARYPTLLSPGDAPALLRDIAADLNRGRSLYYGRLRKTSGNNCSGYSCDIICAADGNHWDVFIDGPDATTNYSGPATPAWIHKGFVDPGRCELVPPQ